MLPRLRLFTFSVCLAFFAVNFSVHAQAETVRSCGIPSSYELSTQSPVGVCDIYTRQLMYRDEAIKLRKQMLKRAVSFQKPRAALYAQYKENLQALHDSIDDSTVSSFFVVGDE